MMKRQYIILGVIAFVVLLGFMIYRSLSGSGTLEITTPNKTPGNASVSVVIQRPGADDQKFTIPAGQTKSVRLGTGIVRVNGSAGGLKSVDIVAIKGFSTTKLQTPSGEQRAIQQRGTNATSCPVIVDHKTYSYNCNGTGGILRHDRTFNSGDPYLFDAVAFTQLQPLKNGLIGFHETTNPYELDYLDLANETVQPVPVPSAVQNLIKERWPSITVSHVAGDERFALTFGSANKLYLFRSINDSNPVEIHLEKNVRLNDDERLASISFDGDHLLVFAGVNSSKGEGNGTYDQPADLPCYLFEYDTNGSLVRTTNLPKFVGVSGLYKLPDNFYAAERDDGFDFYYYNQKKMEQIYSIDEVAGWAIAGNKLYIQASGTLYEFVPKKDGLFSLQSRFASSNIIVSQLFDSPVGLLFTAFAGTSSDAPLNIYQLLSSPQTGTAPDVPIVRDFPGLNGLLDYGLTAEQLTNLKYAFAQYAHQAKLQFTGVAAQNIVPGEHDRFSDNPIDTVTFTALINDTTPYQARVEYTGLSSIRLYLYKPDDGSQVFDSAALAQ